MSDAPIILDLIVITPFGQHNRGDAITDPVTIAAVLLTNASNCVQILQQSGQPTGPVPPPDGAPPPPTDPPPPPPVPDGAGVDFVLSVVASFGDYNRGDQITDPAAIALALRDNASSVVMTDPTPDLMNNHGL